MICRACGADNLEPYLDLGAQPLANAYRDPNDKSPETSYPLEVLLCPVCGLSQLSIVVPPEILYKDYAYASGASEGWKRHCQELAQDVLQGREGAQFIIDIGSNDGTLLDAFHGHRTLGVDPTSAPPDLAAYWTASLGAQFQADIVTATNVFGHVADPLDFLKGVQAALKPDGLCIIECPHIIPLLERTAFDTIYHEHVSYWALGPLELIATAAGLTVTDVVAQEVHGGTMRYYLRHRGSESRPRVRWLLKAEREFGLTHIAAYEDFARRVQQVRARLAQLLNLTAGKTLWAYGASAKGNTLLNSLRKRVKLPAAIVDDTPLKQGKLTPGTRIPIVPPQDLSAIDVVLLLAWNWASEIRQRARAAGFRGRFLCPIPTPILE